MSNQVGAQSCCETQSLYLGVRWRDPELGTVISLYPDTGVLEIQGPRIWDPLQQTGACPERKTRPGCDTMLVRVWVDGVCPTVTLTVTKSCFCLLTNIRLANQSGKMWNWLDPQHLQKLVLV